MWTGDATAILDEIEEFLTGVRRGPEPGIVLAERGEHGLKGVPGTWLVYTVVSV